MLDKDRIECGMYQSIENSCLRTQGVMIPCGVRDREQDKQTVKEHYVILCTFSCSVPYLSTNLLYFHIAKNDIFCSPVLWQSKHDPPSKESLLVPLQLLQTIVLSNIISYSPLRTLLN